MYNTSLNYQYNIAMIKFYHINIMQYTGKHTHVYIYNIILLSERIFCLIYKIKVLFFFNKLLYIKKMYEFKFNKQLYINVNG